jgi:hypothetical protein
MTTLLEFFGYDIDLLGKIGVYSIHHKHDPTKLYIGSTSVTKKHNRKTHHGFYKRFYDHVRSLKMNSHHSGHLQNIVNKYGIEGLVFQILEVCEGLSKDDIFKKEQSYMDTLKPIYNVLSTVHPQGRYWTKEDKVKASQKMRGKPLPQFVYQRIKKPIYQFTLTGKFIKKFDSKVEASKKLNIDPSSMSNCALGRRSSAGGYKWSYTYNQ